MNGDFRVIIRRCDDYDPDRIEGIVREGMEQLGVKPSGRVLLKPNVVIAHPEMFAHAFTRSEFLDGALAAVKSVSGNIEELGVGERSGITIPTRFCFSQAGYPSVIKKHRAKTHYFDESEQVSVQLFGKGRLRDRIFVPKPVVDCDCLINLPKFKAHPWTRLTLSLKNYIGIQDDRHRLVDHNSFLEHKIADLQEVVRPHFIAVDGIIAGQKMMLTPTPFPMGAIVMGTNPCAVDTVGCHMVRTDPEDVIHLKIAAQRGFGPIDPDSIEILGDFPLDEVREKTEGFQFCMEHIDDYFAEEPGLTCTVGTFPEAHSRDYCWGGCPGALQEAAHIMRGVDPELFSSMQPVRYVVGSVDGPLDLAPGERVIFAGDCTAWEGTILGKKVKIEPTYKTVSEVDEAKTPSNDMLMKNIEAIAYFMKNRSSPYVHLKGCPVSVAQHVHALSFLGKVSNPNFDPRLLIPINVAYWRMKLGRLFG